MKSKLFFLLVYLLIISMICESYSWVGTEIDSLSNSEKERQPIEELKTIPLGTEIWISSFSTTVILTGKFVIVDETELIIEQDEKQISVPLADIKRVRMEQSSSGVTVLEIVVSAVGLLVLLYGAFYGALKGMH